MRTNVLLYTIQYKLNKLEPNYKTERVHEAW